MLSASEGSRSSRVGCAAGAGFGNCNAKAIRDRGGEVLMDVDEMRHHADANVRPLDLAQLEHQGVADVLLLDIAVWLMKNCRAWL